MLRFLISIGLGIAVQIAPAGPGLADASGVETIHANPTDYLSKIARLRPGDTLLLEAGVYRRGLTLKSLHGQPGKPIIIGGPADRSAIILGRVCCSTVELREASYLMLRNLTLDGARYRYKDGIKATGVTHNVTIQNILIVRYGSHQQTVGISTKAPAWDWAIRRNVIIGAGTGIYLGDSDGSAPFVRGLVENNVVIDTIGYGMQIKHQNARPDIAAMPTDKGVTTIRYNVFAKAVQPTAGYQAARPNLLVGHFPPHGPGAEDRYEIYGNLLYQNRTDQPLFQGEGNFAFHDNLLVNDYGSGIWVQAHNDTPRRVAIFNNTIVARELGIKVADGDPEFTQRVVGNAVFSGQGIRAQDQRDNVQDSYAKADAYLNMAAGEARHLDLYPRCGVLAGAPIDLEEFSEYRDYDKDFNRFPRRGRYRGAYAGCNKNAGVPAGRRLMP